jgi:hypothetical protein
MEIIYNECDSEFIIINIKIDYMDILDLDLINKYYVSIAEWIKTILDKYNNTYNWKFYICNLHFRVMRIFITIDKQNYAKVDDTKTIYITNYFINNNPIIINLDKLISLFNIQDFILFLHSNTNIESDNSTQSDYSYESDSNSSEETEDGNILIKNIGISGITKETFISELKKIPLLKINTNKFNSLLNTFHEDIYNKLLENNILFWITSNNNYIIYNKIDNDTNSLLHKFTNQI